MGDRKKAKRKYDRMLEEHVGKKEIIALFTPVDSIEANVFGYLLAMSEYYLLMQIQYDLEIDGYAIIPKTAFDSLEFGNKNKMRMDILAAEGTDSIWGIDHDIDLTDWHTIFACLQKLDMHVIVRRGVMEYPEFVIGPITDVRKRSVSVRYYNAEGQLDAKATKVKYDDITKIEFGDKYSLTFRKYLKPMSARKLK